MKILQLLFFLTTIVEVYSQSTFTSNGSANWNTKTNWLITGALDSDSIPDSNDDVIISNGDVVSLNVSGNAKSLNINAGGSFNWNFNLLSLYGNFTNSGSINGAIKLYFYANAVLSSTVPLIFGKTTTERGLLQVFSSNLTVAAGTILNIRTSANGGNCFGLISIRNSSQIINNGTIETFSLGNGGASGTINNFLTNSSGSSFTIASPFNITSGNLTITNQLGSSFSVISTSIPNFDYYNLNVQGTGSSSATSNLVVNNDLTVSSGTLSLGNNTISVTGNLTNSGTISSSGTINVAGNMSFSATGNLASNNTSTIVMNGSSAQSVTNSNSTTLALYNFTCSNNSGVTLSSGNFSIKNILTVTSGTLNVGTNRLTMLSDATSTAIIGNSSGSISGSMILQRYIHAGVYRKYDLGSTVTSTTIDDWDNELFMSIGATNDGSSPAYLGGDGAAGGTKSVFIYDNQLNTSKKYVAVNTGTTLTPGRGYQTLVADDITGFPGRAIDSRGTPNMGSISLPVFINGTDGFNLVANPFQAEIDWANVTKSSVSNTVYFIEYNGTKSTYLTPRTNPKINPGLGFMCVATGANPSVSITQNSKTSNTASTFGARLSQLTDEASDLKLRISSSQNAEYNEADLFFDKKAISGFDFEKDFLFGESLIEDAPIITFTDAGKQFVRNYFNDEIETVYFPLSITTPIAGNYSIDLEGLYESNVYQDAYLMNNLTKEKYKLTNNQTASIYFDKNTHEQFQLVLSKKSSDEINSAATSNLINVFATASDIVIKNGTINQQEVSIKVYSALGQLVLNQTSELSEKSELRIPTETFKSDVYFIQLRTALGNEFTKKIVITK